MYICIYKKTFYTEFYENPSNGLVVHTTSQTNGQMRSLYNAFAPVFNLYRTLQVILDESEMKDVTKHRRRAALLLSCNADVHSNYLFYFPSNSNFRALNNALLRQ
jgi:hypothetical protein